jgi:hypothetical protein
VALTELDFEALYTPEADLSVYESLTERELYLTLMRSAFNYQGKPADDDSIMAEYHTVYLAASNSAVSKTDRTIKVEGEDRPDVRLQTSVIDDAYAGVANPWGPSASIILSVIKDGEVIRLNAGGIQEHQELLLDAVATTCDPLTSKVTEELFVVERTWAGNVGDTKASKDARAYFEASAFSELTPEEKRIFGVAIEGLSLAAAAPALQSQ